MDCFENVPEFPNELAALLNPVEYIRFETSVEAYYRLVEEIASYYNITLCDADEAVLVAYKAFWIVGQGARLSQIYRPFLDDIFPDRDMYSPEDFDVSDHFDFLLNYLRLHGLSFEGTVNEKLRPLYGTPNQSTWDGLVNWIKSFGISSSDVVSEIRRLTAVYSVATPIPEDAVQATEGGIVVRGITYKFPTCDPGLASRFKSDADRKINGRWSKFAPGAKNGGTGSSPEYKYQIKKCGPREYSLRVNASNSSHKPLADGLAPTKPPKAPAAYSIPCCILEAKYVRNRKTSPRQRLFDYVREKMKGVPKRPKKLRWGALIAAASAWGLEFYGQRKQLGGYLGAIADPDIPYSYVVYICSTKPCRNYYRSIMTSSAALFVKANACYSDTKLIAKGAHDHWIV